ncbi:TIGR03759 family integrating conjugative element protein [Dickeya oryzae]|uniref:TIGR03759 family integrating conjugative element protein n=1 Tax=Dickeya oryzae TaxID=1240404 RepID=A0AB39IY37_9GAMM|nr:TIGR03759 family integrating conjugative element protein [Dickeya oryzae]MCA6990814.1 TIGR03759 family integrating conjugative element protein [Dickeya oryzae]
MALAADKQDSSVQQSQSLSSLQQSIIRDEQQRQASAWGLSANEWQRYQQLMNGPRGVQSPGLDPLTALGIESDNPTDRRRLAELWVKQEFQRTEKELAFQREVNAAWTRLYPNSLAVNMGNATGIAHDTSGRLALFVQDNCSRCDARLAAILADNRPVDIYLVDSNGSDDKVRNWAIAHRIPVDRVRSRQITLNHDKGLWMQYGQGQMPVVLQQGDGGWQIAAF